MQRKQHYLLRENNQKRETCKRANEGYNWNEMKRAAAELTIVQNYYID